MTSKRSRSRLGLVLATLVALAGCADDAASSADAASAGSGAGSGGTGGGAANGGSGAMDGGSGTGGSSGDGAGSGGSSGTGTSGSGGMGSGGTGGRDAGPQDDASTPTDGGDSGATMPVIVSSGANHQLALSIDDGMTWCVTNYDSSLSDYDNPHLLRNVTYANGWFISGSQQDLFRSRNGYAWEELTGEDEPALHNWVGQVEFGNGWWVATGGYGSAMRSMDMINWTDVSDEMPGTEGSRTLAFGDGLFVTGRDNVGWWQSSDGTGWTQRDPNAGTEVIFDGQDFVARPGYDCDGELCLRGNGNEIQRSTNGGANFSPVASLPDSSAGRFAFGRAPEADFAAAAAIPSDIRACLGL